MFGTTNFRGTMGVALVPLLLGFACARPVAAPSDGTRSAGSSLQGTTATAPAPTATGQVSAAPSPASAPPTPANGSAAPSAQPTQLSSLSLSVEDGTVEPPFPRLLGQELSVAPGGPPWTLKAEWSGLSCHSSVVLSPGGRLAVYENATKILVPRPGRRPEDRILQQGDRATPNLRLLDTRTGEDRLFAEGACAPAWSADGRLAFVQGDPPTGEYDRPYAGRVMVRASLKSEAVAWTSEPGEYGRLVWAGDRLLAFRARHPERLSTVFDLVVFDGPDEVRVLETDDPTLVAVSPDGTRALTTTMAGQYENQAAVARVLRVADAMELARLMLTREQLPNVYDGAWADERVIAQLGVVPGGTTHPRPALAILDLRGGRLVVEHVLEFKRGGKRDDMYAQGFGQVVESRFLDPKQRRFGAWHAVAGVQYRYMECDLDAGRCVRGPPVEGGGMILDLPGGSADK